MFARRTRTAYTNAQYADGPDMPPLIAQAYRRAQATIRQLKEQVKVAKVQARTQVARREREQRGDLRITQLNLKYLIFPLLLQPLCPRPYQRSAFLRLMFHPTIIRPRLLLVARNPMQHLMHRLFHTLRLKDPGAVLPRHTPTHIVTLPSITPLPTLLLAPPQCQTMRCTKVHNQ